MYDLLQYKAELNVGGLRQVDDGTGQTVVIARVEQLREQSVFRRVSAHTCMRTGPRVWLMYRHIYPLGGSVAEWLACWTQAQKGPGSNRSRDAVG